MSVEESVSSSLVSPELALRMTLGRAIETLSKLKAQRYPDDASTRLKNAAEEIDRALETGSDADATARSLGDYAEWHELLLRVSRVESGHPESLRRAARELRALAQDPRSSEMDRLQALQQTLRTVRSCLSTARVEVPVRSSTLDE